MMKHFRDKAVRVLLYCLFGLSVAALIIQRWSSIAAIALFAVGTVISIVFFLESRSRHVETVVLLSRIKGKKSIQVDIDLNDDDLTKTESKATYQQIQEYVEEKHNLKVSSLYIAQVKRKHGIMEVENYNKGTKGGKQPSVTIEKQKAIEDALSYYQMI